MEEKVFESEMDGKYAELTQENIKLKDELRRMYLENKELKEIRGLQRLDFLFKILDNHELFGKETTEKVVKDIKESFGYLNNDTES